MQGKNVQAASRGRGRIKASLYHLIHRERSYGENANLLGRMKACITMNGGHIKHLL